MVQRIVFERRYICFVQSSLAWFDLGPLVCFTEYVNCVHIFFSKMAVANDCFCRRLYIFYPPQSERLLLHAHIRPLLLNETNGERQPTFAAPATRIHLPISTAPPSPLLGCRSQVHFWPISLSSRRMSIVGGGASDDTDARLHFGVGSPGGGSRLRGQWIG